MFNFAWGEIVVIGIVALIAIGPKELPTVLRSIGQFMGKIRRMANEFQGQFQEALREAELSDLQKQASDFTNSITNYDPVAETQKDIEKTFTNHDPLATTADIKPLAIGEPPEIHTATADASPGATPDATPDAAPVPAGHMPTIDVPLPDPPPAVTNADFALPEPSPPDAVPTPAGELPSLKQGGGNA